MKLDLTDQHFQVIVEALNNTAFRFSAPVLQEIQSQLADQPVKIDVPKNE